MNQPDHQFRVVLRGYEPADVDRVVQDLQGRIGTAERHAAELAERLRQTESAASTAAESTPPPVPSFAHLGERVGQILALAEEEATALRDQAIAEVEVLRKDAEQAALATREAADAFAEQKQRDTEAEITQLLTDARRAADEERDAAERDSSARRQEAEAIYERQRADAAKATADFETTLAERRQRTTAEFQEQQAASQARLDEMAARIEDMEATAQRRQTEAEAEARRIVTEAEERGAVLTRDARTTADRVRAESDRELAAAAQRRDSINAQLTNVRQMLATLTGTAHGFAAPDTADVADAADDLEGGTVNAESVSAASDDVPEDDDADVAERS